MPEIIEFKVIEPPTTAEVREHVADALVADGLVRLIVEPQYADPSRQALASLREVTFRRELDWAGPTDANGEPHEIVGTAPGIASIVVEYALDPAEPAMGHMAVLED
jgi:hypothetical protein